MSYFIVDVEADGPCPGLYSMHEFGAVLVEPGITKTFYGQCKPISEQFNREALAVSGKTREETLQYPDGLATMKDFNNWILSNNKDGRPIFFSDNLAFDWQFINYYFHLYLGENPFGYSGRRIGDIYCGLKRDLRTRWKHLRKTAHTHHPVDDAKGNAEALMTILAMF